MTFDPAKALVSYHAALDGQDLKAVAAYLAPDARYVSVGLGDVTGRDAILAAMAKYFEASADHQAFDDVVRAVSSHVAESKWRLRATNKITGEVIERRGLETVRFNGDGNIVLISVEDRP